MKTFETVYEAVRYIKQNLPEDIYNEMYLMWYEDREAFHVSDSTDDLEKLISSDFYNWGYDSDNPEEHAFKYKVWSYTHTENMKQWPVLYSGYRKTPLSKLHLRGKANAGGETIASFSVSRY